MMRQQPKKLKSKDDREMARRMRDWHWEFADRVAVAGTIWLCWWNRNGRHNKKNAPSDLVICGLIDGMELLEWLRSHKEWWNIGEWSDERYAAPVTITAVGRTALANRDAYDLEPVTGGMVEPGWQAIPTPRRVAKAGKNFGGGREDDRRVRQAARRLKVVQEHFARTKGKPLSDRQAAVLAYARLQVAGDNPFPSIARIAAWGRKTGSYSPYNVYDVLLGLAARGLIEATSQTPTRRGVRADGWRITDAGWAE